MVALPAEDQEIGRIDPIAISIDVEAALISFLRESK
jgi:hypothetical protein